MLNTPTANLATENELIPKEGVYAVRVSFEKHVYDGVANLGRNPTFKEGKLSYEVHILDFHKNLLARSIRVHFIKRIRKNSHASKICSNILSLTSIPPDRSLIKDVRPFIWCEG